MSVKDQIQEVLAAVRPGLQLDGGDIEFVGFDEKTGEVQVRLQGACKGCPMASVTLKWGIEATLTEAIPEVRSVVNLDDEE